MLMEKQNYNLISTTMLEKNTLKSFFKRWRRVSSLHLF